MESLETLGGTWLGRVLSRRGWGVPIVATYDGLCEIGCVGMRLEALASVSGVFR